MQYILDTHTLIWFLEDSPKLSNEAKKRITNIQNQCFISICSLWEIAIKLSINKLSLDVSFDDFKTEIQRNDFTILPIEFEHLQQLQQLKFHHRDPFDRLIIAQAQSENIAIISKDENFRKYENVTIIW